MPDPSILEKLDIGLILALRAYEATRDTGNADDGISVTLRFEGDLAPIEALGFETHSVWGDQVMGVVRFKDVPTLTAHPGVLSLSAGIEGTPDLDTALPDIKARAADEATVGTTGLWHPMPAMGVLKQHGDATGKGVIIAVIDTGIDFTHPMFLSQLTPTKKTRILRIWDQGLVPASLAECPPVERLGSLQPYGVEYDDAEIDAALNGGTPVLHKDCESHGTHVAGIAAGGVIFPAGGDTRLVGVAPEADIIAVKAIDVPGPIRFQEAAGPGAAVQPGARFRDAVLYCLRTAKELGKPVVINMSFGDNLNPGDGLDDDTQWVDGLMDPAQSPGLNAFRRGAVVVTGTGNDGDPTRRSAARIIVPAGGEITVPLEIIDTRNGLQERWLHCARKLHKPTIFTAFWYRRADPFTAVEFALRLPNQPGFSADMGVGGNLDLGFVVRAGTPPTVAFVPIAGNAYEVFVTHGGDAAVPHPAGGTVRRHKVVFGVIPRESGGVVSYHEGINEVRIRAPAGTELFLMCRLVAWAPKKTVYLRIADTMFNGDPLDAGIDVTAEFTLTGGMGRHVITVAGYDDTNGDAQHADHHAIASFSSRGPLRDFSNPPRPPIADKPDIAAPCVNINSALGADTDLTPAIRLPSWKDGVRFIEFSGTSMASPMIAGVIALMLDKNPDLSTDDVRALLTAAAREGASPAPTVVPPPPGTPTHKNAYGSGMVDALTTHTNTS